MSVKDFEICPECEGEGSPSNPANCKPGSYCKRCGGTGKIMRIGNPDSLPKQLCNSCGKTQPIMPNGKCFICGFYPSEFAEKIANRVYPAKEEMARVSLKLTITDRRTGQSYDDPTLELPGTFDEFMIAFLIWKRDFEKPKIVDPDFLRKMRIGL
jgi:DnaJ-class molecular chaperone